MPSPPWANPEQTEHMMKRLPDFLAAQRNKTTQEFWKTTYREFFERWTDPQDETPVHTVPTKRKAKERPNPAATMSHTEWVKLRKNQIYNWFNNRGNGANPRRQAPVVVIGSGGSQSNQRILSEIQLYSKKYYDTRVRDRVAEVWKATVAQSQGSSLDKRARIVIINKCIAQCWSEESDEIKAEIREEHTKLKELKDLPVETPSSSTALTQRSPENLASALLSMPQMAKDFLHQMHNYTGYAYTLLSGGPDPHRPGRMRVLAFHEGVDRFDQKFSTAYGSFNSNVMEPFQKFLYNMKREEDGALLCITNSQARQDQGPDNTASEPPHKRPRLEGDASTEDVENIPPASSSKPPIPAASVRGNLALHPSLNAAGSSSTPASSHECHPIPAPSGSTPFVQAAPVSSSATPSSSTQYLPIGPIASGSTLFVPEAPILSMASAADQDVRLEFNPNTVVCNDQFQSAIPNLVSVGGLDHINYFDVPFTFEEFQEAMMDDMNQWDISTAEALAILNRGSTTSPLNMSTAAGSNLPTISNTTTSCVGSADTHFGPTPSVPAPLNPATATTSQQVASAAQMYPTPAEPVIPTTSDYDGRPYTTTVALVVPVDPATSAVSETTTAVVPTHVPQDVGPSVEAMAPPNPPAAVGQPVTLTVPPTASISPSDVAFAPFVSPPDSAALGTLPPQTSTSCIPPSSEQDGHSGGGEERLSRNRKPPMSKEVQPVIWLELAHTYLVKDLDDEKWKACIQQWFEFEKEVMSAMDTNSRRIPAKARPASLSKWLGSRNYTSIPKINDEAAFGLEWLTWWNEMQPKWRKSPLPSVLPLPIVSAKPKEDLLCLKKGGPTGLVTVLIGLKWWAGRRGSDGVWEAAVADVMACISTTGTAGQSKKKRLS